MLCLKRDASTWVGVVLSFAEGNSMTMADEKWSLMRKINNFSLLRMLSVGKDWHLRHCLKFLTQEEKKEFDGIAKRYLMDELHRLERSLDDCMKSLSSLFLGDSGGNLMDLHLRSQRALRDHKHRDHVNHMLGTWLLTAYLIQMDLEVLTLTRNDKYFRQRLLREGIASARTEKHPRFYPAEDTLLLYPPGEIFAKAFDYGDTNKGKYYYADTFYFLFLFHDIGYLLELVDKVAPDLREEIKQALDDLKVSEYQKYDALRRDHLKTFLSFPYSERSSRLQSLVDVADHEFSASGNHGVASSLILYRNFEHQLLNKRTENETRFVQEVGQDEQIRYKREFLYDCLAAICLHDLAFEERISIQDSLHYFLLKFSDAVCDWSRGYVGRKTFYPLELIDEILVGFRPEEKGGEKRLRVNIVFDFSNLEALVSEDVGEPDYEVNDFKKKVDDLNQLDYEITIPKKGKHQWFFFEMILIDRNGERHKIDNNEGNTVKYTKIECPLFSFDKMS